MLIEKVSFKGRGEVPLLFLMGKFKKDKNDVLVFENLEKIN